jgi:hypothetical protein
MGGEIVKVSEIRKYLRDVYFAEMDANGERTSILLIGKPGIGKSLATMLASQDIARELNKEWIDYDDSLALQILENPEKYFVYNDMRLYEHEPSDFIGIPRDKDGYTMFSPIAWAKVMSKCAGFLVLDEFTNVNRNDLITVSYKLLNDRKAGYYKFHKDVMIVAIGNRPEDAPGIAHVPVAPVLNRCEIRYVEPPTVEDWYNFMQSRYGDNWAKETYAFLASYASEKQNLLCYGYPPEDTIDNFATPRSWTKLARRMYFGYRDFETIISFLGREVGQKFYAFLQCNVSLNDILDRPEMYPELKIDAQYMVLFQMANAIEEGKHLKSRRTEEVDERYLRLLQLILHEKREHIVALIHMIGTSKLKKFLNIMCKLSGFKEIEKYLNELYDKVQEVKQYESRRT